MLFVTANGNTVKLGVDDSTLKTLPELTKQHAWGYQREPWERHGQSNTRPDSKRKVVVAWVVGASSPPTVVCAALRGEIRLETYLNDSPDW